MRVRIAVVLLSIASLLGCFEDTLRPPRNSPALRPTRRLIEPPGATPATRGSPGWTIDNEFAYLNEHDIPGFAGFYLTPEEEPVVLLRDTSHRSAAQEWANEFRAKLRMAERPVTVRTASYDWGQLTQVRRAMDSLHRELEILSTDIDEFQNKVVIGVRTQNARLTIEQHLQAREIPIGMVEVVVESSPVEFGDTLWFYKRPVNAGRQIARNNSNGCSLGFSAIAGNAMGFFTASHCSAHDRSLNFADSMFQPSASSPSNLIGLEIMDRPDYECAEENSDCRWADAAFFEYQGGVTYSFGFIARPVDTARTSTTADGPLGVAGTFEIVDQAWQGTAYGLTVHKVGTASGWSKGPITATCVNMYTGRAEDLACQDEVALRSKSGDSGAPVFFVTDSASSPWRVMLLGLQWGGDTTNLPTSMYTVFGKLGNIYNDFGLFYSCIQNGTYITSNDCYAIGELVASIDGPVNIPYATGCEWTAAVYGGLPPYSYSWSGTLGGSGPTIYGEANGALYLAVSSGDSQYDEAQTYVSQTEEGACW